MADTRQDDPKNKGLKGIFGHRDKNGTRQGGFMGDVSEGIGEANREIGFAGTAALGGFGALAGTILAVVGGGIGGVIYENVSEAPVDTNIQAAFNTGYSYSVLQRDDSSHILMVKDEETVRIFLAEPDSNNFMYVDSYLQALSLSAEVVRGFDAARLAIEQSVLPQESIYNFADVEELSGLFSFKGEYQRNVEGVMPEEVTADDVVKKLEAEGEYWQDGAQRIMAQEYGINDNHIANADEKVDRRDVMRDWLPVGAALGALGGLMFWPVTAVGATAASRRRRLGLKSKKP